MKIDMLNENSLHIRSSLRFQEIPYDKDKDSFVRDGIEYPTEEEAYEMFQEEEDERDCYIY